MHTGEYREGMRWGHGQYLYTSGAIFTGEFLKDRKTGKGTLTTAWGHSYTGDWRKDRPHGQGIQMNDQGEVIAEGFFYKGKLSRPNTRQGESRQRYPQQQQEGDFSDQGGLNPALPKGYYGERNATNEKHGTGTMNYPNGDVYRGQWQHNKKSGYGRYEFADGAIYEGEYRDGLKHGQGVYV